MRRRAAASTTIRWPPRMPARRSSLHWLTRGYGYEITSADVWGAYAETLRAAEGISAVEDTRERIRQLVVNDSSVGQLVTTVVGRILGLR